jgi:hypothetical protein
VGSRGLEEREIVIEGPFTPEVHRDVVFAKATVTVRQPPFEDQTYRVCVVVPTFDIDATLGPLSQAERDEAVGWFALVQLAETPSHRLTAPGAGALAEVRVSIGARTGACKQWGTIREVREYKDRALSGYDTKYDQGQWSAKPKRTKS